MSARSDRPRERLLRLYEDAHLKNTFRELFIGVYFEILRRERPECELDKRTASVILAREPLRTDAAHHWKDLIVWVLREWRLLWRRWADCFSDLTIEQEGRLRVRDTVDRIERVTALILDLGLSRPSARRLHWLARNICPGKVRLPSGALNWCACHSDINGSIGITHDLDRETSTLRIAPRTFLVVERIGATDGLYYCRKQRDTLLSQLAADRIVSLQRDLVGAFMREFARLERTS